MLKNVTTEKSLEETNKESLIILLKQAISDGSRELAIEFNEKNNNMLISRMELIEILTAIDLTHCPIEILHPLVTSLQGLKKQQLTPFITNLAQASKNTAAQYLLAIFLSNITWNGYSANLTDAEEVLQKKAIAYLEKQAELEKPLALYALAKLMKDSWDDWGELIKKDNKLKFTRLEQVIKLTDHNDIFFSDALVEIADMYETGLGVAANPIAAGKYYQEAAKLNNITALQKIAKAYKVGSMGFAINVAKARECYETLITLGDPLGYAILAEFYRTGHGVTIDTDKYIEYTLKAAELGMQHLYLEIAHYYLEKFAASDPSYINKAYELYKKAGGLAYAAIRIAKVYFKGLYDVPIDIPVAIKYYKKTVSNTPYCNEVLRVVNSLQNDENINYYDKLEMCGELYLALLAVGYETEKMQQRLLGIATNLSRRSTMVTPNYYKAAKWFYRLAYHGYIDDNITSYLELRKLFEDLDLDTVKECFAKAKNSYLNLAESEEAKNSRQTAIDALEVDSFVRASRLLKTIFSSELNHSNIDANSFYYLFAKAIIDNVECALGYFLDNPEVLVETLTYIFSPGRDLRPMIKGQAQVIGDTVHKALAISKDNGAQNYLCHLDTELLARVSLFACPKSSKKYEPEFTQEERIAIATNAIETTSTIARAC